MVRFILAGILGAIVLMIWAFVANAILGIFPRAAMNRVTDAEIVYETLKDNVTTPGGYIVDAGPGGPEQSAEPQPVFSIRYSGMGHEAAGMLQLRDIGVALAAVWLATGLLLLVGSPRALSSYVTKLVFFMGIGLMLFLFDGVTEFGIGGYPVGSGLMLGLNQLIGWTAVGLVTAAIMRPRAARSR